MHSKKFLTPEEALKKVRKLYSDYLYATEISEVTNSLLQLSNLQDTPETRNGLKKLVRLRDAKYRCTKEAYISYLQELSNQPNAKEIYLFLVPQVSSQTLKFFDATVASQPYGADLLLLMMENKDFSGFSDQAEILIVQLKKKQKQILEKYFSMGYGLCEEAETYFFSSSRDISVIEKYFAHNNGVCFAAQQKMCHQLPLPKMVQILEILINGINANNHEERLLCIKLQFTLLQTYQNLFQKYIENMQPYYEFTSILAPQIVYVARKKQWL